MKGDGDNIPVTKQAWQRLLTGRIMTFCRNGENTVPEAKKKKKKEKKNGPNKPRETGR